MREVYGVAALVTNWRVAQSALSDQTEAAHVGAVDRAQVCERLLAESSLFAVGTRTRYRPLVVDRLLRPQTLAAHYLMVSLAA